MAVGRPYHVFDLDGEHLGSFADWDTAHGWARLQVVLGGVPAPVEVEDRRNRVTHRLWADHCEQLAPPAAVPPRPRQPTDSALGAASRASGAPASCPAPAPAETAPTAVPPQA
ncbi:MAG: hypothetical protein IRZ08_05205 [Frankia sp.]|nr:hypothetical protein [Frankia sp.]